MLKEYQIDAETFKTLETRKPGKARLHVTGALALTQISVLDSIDGRALGAGLILLWQPTIGRAGQFCVRKTKTGERLVVLPLKTPPQTLGDLPATLLGGALHDALDGRALICLHHLKVQLKTMNLVVKNQTIADAVCALEGDGKRAWMWVDPRKGFENAASSALKPIGNAKAKMPAFSGVLDHASKAAQLNSKGFPTLTASQPAAQAIQLLHETLLAQMTSQVDGTCKDLDIEFLHDLRVASRRARSLLQTVKTVLSEEAQAYGIERYRWLGQETTALRDLDVYLYDYPALQEALSPEMRIALEPFRLLLETERKRAFSRVKTVLKSRAFSQFAQSWGDKLAADESYQGKDAGQPIGAIAAKAIWKRYGRICADGQAITDDTPAEALHDLRKQGKKLRYLLEFFASLYPAAQIKPRIGSLKKLQDLLGAYQDCAVQAAFLEDKAAKLRKDVSVPAETLMAMGALADQRLQDEKRLRRDFQAFFKPFASAPERAGYKGMLNL
ncbi:MAG: CHAD domain-containing protein [Pseudomonadota bacterium]